MAKRREAVTCGRAVAIHTAILRLASLFECGALQADTDPAAFLQRVADEVERLRRVEAKAP